MPVVERIDWALGQLNMGRSGHIVIGPAKDPARFKVKLLLKPVGSGAPAPVTRSGLEAVLLHIKQLAMVNVAMDRGHRHTTGAAEIAIWIRCGAVRPAKHRNRHGCHEEEEKDEEKEKDSKPNAEQAPPEATGASTANALTAETAPDTPRNDETEARGAAADEKQEIEEAEKKDTEKAEKKDAHAADEDAQPRESMSEQKLRNRGSQNMSAKLCCDGSWTIRILKTSVKRSGQRCKQHEAQSCKCT